MAEYQKITKPSNLEGGLIVIQNDGALITETNYFSLDMADAGLLFMTTNARCLRLLIPESQSEFIPEMLTGKKIGIARGKNRTHNKMMTRILFDDFTSTTFYIDLGDEQLDRKIGKGEKGLRFIAYDHELNIVIDKKTSVAVTGDVEHWYG